MTEKNKKEKVLCVYCEKQIKDFKKEGLLIAWTNDPKDPKSLNKIARSSHVECFTKFIFMNMGYLKEILSNLTKK